MAIKTPTVHIDWKGDDDRRSVFLANGDSELLKLSCVSPNHFRLEESSLLLDANYHDVIRASVREDGSLEFHEITSRSELLTSSWVLSKDLAESAELSTLLEFVTSVGGAWERVLGGLLLIHLPPESADVFSNGMKHFPSKATHSPT